MRKRDRTLWFTVSGRAHGNSWRAGLKRAWPVTPLARHVDQERRLVVADRRGFRSLEGQSAATLLESQEQAGAESDLDAFVVPTDPHRRNRVPIFGTNRMPVLPTVLP